MENLTGEFMSDDEIMGMFGGADIPEDQADDNADSDDDYSQDDDQEYEEDDGSYDEDSDYDDEEEDEEDDDSYEDDDDDYEEEETTDNVYSALAKALSEEGLFPDITEEDLESVESGQDLKKLMQAQMKHSMGEAQRRLDWVISGGASTEETRQAAQYENVMAYLKQGKDYLEDESDEGDTFRSQIIYQDFINRGYSEDRAKKEVERAFERGTEIEDAKEAYTNTCTLYTNQYNAYLDDLGKKASKRKSDIEQKAQKVKDIILNQDFELFKGMDISKKTRLAAYDAISKPVYKDPNSGTLYTALQKKQMDNDENFQAILGLCYALTDGFTSVNKLVDSKANKAIKKGFSHLESVIANSSRDSNGNLRFASGTNDSNSYLGKGVKLDL